MTQHIAITCTDCGKEMTKTTSMMPMWLGAELKLIENVEVHVCDTCQTQAFDPAVDTAIRMLTATGFPDRIADRQLVVPVFDLTPFLPNPAKVAAE